MRDMLCAVCSMTGLGDTPLLEQAVYGDEALAVGIYA